MGLTWVTQWTLATSMPTCLRASFFLWLQIPLHVTELNGKGPWLKMLHTLATGHEEVRFVPPGNLPLLNLENNRGSYGRTGQKVRWQKKHQCEEQHRTCLAGLEDAQWRLLHQEFKSKLTASKNKSCRKLGSARKFVPQSSKHKVLNLDLSPKGPEMGSLIMILHLK